jgi:molybdate-binding protein/DNA-binding XRE family transcriptional regulator
MAEIENNLGRLREKRSLSAIELASRAGVSRQTIYAIEAGSYVPNTAVALRLARILETSVEDLFALPADEFEPELPRLKAQLLPGSEPLQSGQPVQLCQVDKQLIASAPSPVRWYFPAADAVMAGKSDVQAFHSGAEFRNRILAAGCDPGISVLARHAQSAGVELVLAHRNSSQALDLLKEGVVHIAGTHLQDESSGESNLPEIGRLFPKRSIAVVSFAIWEEGILTAPANPKNIRTIEDFARRDVTIVNREKGAGSRRLLDAHLKRLQIPAARVRGYERLAAGHLPAAWQVKSGEADACIATAAAARLFGLRFVPLVSERYDLAVRRHHLDVPPMQKLLDILSHSSFRRELESLGGYDTTPAGQRLI